MEKYEVKWEIHWPGEKISLVCTYNTAFSIRGGSRRSHQILLLHDYHETFHGQPDYFQFKKNHQRKETTKSSNLEKKISNIWMFLDPNIFFSIWILIVLIYKIWETSKNKLKKHFVTKNCSDISLFEQIVLVVSKCLQILGL